MATIDYRKFNKKKLGISESTIQTYEIVPSDRITNMQLLLKYKSMYDALATYRANRRRTLDYTFGKQWKDIIEDPDNYGSYITEEEHIKRQGIVPLKNNLMRSLNKSVIGLFRKNNTAPMAVSRDRDEQKLGEMMTIALQYVMQTNDAKELDARLMQEALIGGVYVQDVRNKWLDDREMFDVSLYNINPSMCFFNGGMNDPLMRDLRTFGVLHDLPIATVLSKFAKSKEQAEHLRKLYISVNTDVSVYYQTFSGETFRSNDFFVPAESNKCRVIEVWDKEYRQALRCHDTLSAETYTISIKEQRNIDMENANRISEALEQGVDSNDVPLIEYEWFIEEFWAYRFFTPNGEILDEGESPFEHKGMPYEVGVFELINGEIHPYSEDVIDQQRYINRMATMIDMMNGTSIKNLTVFDESAEGTMSREEIVHESTKLNGVIFVDTGKKTESGVQPQLPKQLTYNSSVNAGVYEFMNMQLKFLNDIYGVHNSLQGQQAAPGTPAARYAQEAQNSVINLEDFYASFNSFRRRRDYKIMKTISQYYDSPRYINITGRDYSEESHWYDPQKIRQTEFDNVISESMDTTVFRELINNLLMDLFKAGAINAKVMLENISAPFADRILASIQRNEEEMMQNPTNPPQDGLGLPQQVVTGEPNVMIPKELEEMTDPRAMELLNKAAYG